jgi:hypothetical protein
MLRSIVDNVKAFFKRSWSIFLARAEIVTGFVIGVVGAIDWSGFANIDFDAGFTNNQLFWFAIGLVLKGIVSEVGRRSGTVVSTRDQLIPVNIAESKDIPVKK